MIATKSIGFRKLLNGKPQIVINEMGIDYSVLKKLNMNVNDLLESIRASEYFSIEQVSYAIIETNGKISILPNETTKAPEEIPISLIMEGKYLEENIKISSTDKDKIRRYLADKKLKAKDVVLLSIAKEKVFLQPKNAKYITEEGCL